MAKKALIGFTLVFLCLVAHADSGYNIVQMSTAAPVGTQQAFLANTTNAFNASLIANPLVSNTYQIKLFGPNPNYIQPVVSTTIINLDTLANKLTAISTATVVFSYASGMLYERCNDAGILGTYMNLCANATNFIVNPTTTTLAAWKPETCQDALGFMDNWIISQTSGIAIVPNPPAGF